MTTKRMSLTDLATTRTARRPDAPPAALAPTTRVVPVDQILSSRDIAAVLKLDRGAASMIVTRAETNGFPAPITKTAAGRLWDRREVEAWGRMNGYLNPKENDR